MKSRTHQSPLLVILTLSILVSSCMPGLPSTLEPPPSIETQTQTETLSPTPSLTPSEPTLTQTIFHASAVPTQYSPYDQELSLEIKDAGSNEEIAKTLLSLWLDKLTDEEIDAHWRLRSYEFTQVYNPSFLAACPQKLGAVFILDIGVNIETVDPLLCGNKYCDQSNWTAGGGTIIDEFHEYTAFYGALFKSGDTYTLKVINADMPC